MKLLLLTNKPFLPTVDGGTSATRAFINDLLSENFSVKHVTFSSEKHPFDNSLFAQEPWALLNTISIPVKLKVNPFGAILALIRGKSYQLARFESIKMAEIVKELTSQSKYEFVILDSLYSAQMIELFKTFSPESKFILRSHNVESKLTEGKARETKNLFSKFYLTVLSKQLKKREKEILKHCDLVLSISDDDTQTFQSWGNAQIKTLPFFPEQSDYMWKDNPNSFIHFGAMNWQPNIEAYSKLKNILFPEIVKSCPESILKVAGSFMDSLPASNNPAIQQLGFVKNKYEFLANNGILLAPVGSGSGVRVKIIEALSIGVPVITTETGAKGIPTENNNGLIICQSDEEFIKKAIELAGSSEKRELLSKSALLFFQKWRSDYSLKTIFANDVR
jgi:polysaccharide biosynthesis protein PslH